jgi:transcription elongation factor GreA
MAQQERFILTRQGYEELKRELEELEQLQRRRHDRFAEVNYSSDPAREEAAYFETRTRKEFVDQRVDYLRVVLERAEIVEEDPDPMRVDPGDRVTVWDFESDQETTFDLVGNSPEVIFGREGISIESPVGQALLGRRVGDVVEVAIPEGKARYAIRKIERIPPANGS